jgi:hypothetical protein
MHIIDVGMQHYTHIARFTTVTYSLSQKIVKSHVSNYLDIKKINTKFTCNSLALQFVSKN